jgi:hypothetical protein
MHNQASQPHSKEKEENNKPSNGSQLFWTSFDTNLLYMLGLKFIVEYKLAVTIDVS